ncbi:MAG: helix-turn-helix transcriptional regulator [Ruminococcaceae bacterium]|nr:helix-turn-helix transcriptional regulator [Oscillospiraceae bacterium]
MEIGKKVKQLRTEKLMTQSELAGSEITRNMLSQIENGIALPSLSTVSYLAQRLGVSVGFLLANEDDDFMYKKDMTMKNIKKAFTDGNFEICKDLCLSELESTDDEIEFILSSCYINIAVDNICNGMLHKACNNIDLALVHAENTIYDTVSVRNCAYVLLAFLRNISPTLDCVEIYENVTEMCYTISAFENSFCKYILALQTLDAECFDSSIPVERLYKIHILSRIKISREDYAGALSILKDLINSDEVPSKILLYLSSADLELCCKMTEDFRGAYEHSQNKISLLEYMLSDT